MDHGDMSGQTLCPKATTTANKKKGGTRVGVGGAHKKKKKEEHFVMQFSEQTKQKSLREEERNERKEKREIDGKTRGGGPLFILRLTLSFFMLATFVVTPVIQSGQCPKEKQALSLYSSEVHCCDVHNN